MSHAASIQHRLQNRLRVRLSGRRGDEPFFADLVARLSQAPGVLEASASPVTGTVLLRHEGTFDEIRQTLAREGLLEIDPRPERPGTPRRRSGRPSPDPRSLLAVALSSLSALQLTRGQVTGSASENLWNAYRSHVHLGNAPLTALLLLFGAHQLSRGHVLNSATALLFYALTARQAAAETEGSQRESSPRQKSVNAGVSFL